ncbi:aminopeptidase P family protein [Bradyrhizobium diazoefficiens]|uniref:M24 family metallopeptidase n=1 Tax=Bradyrhizobium diazoefficiens TaxID=1355477 RepID=UPI00190C5A43|nr:Xaa-Pro peptidase family protein [Bradyrhizobium diazoefficiens]MBK3662788.1 aminopeptidase P family protein [Bradyrhizobium diazoefficiens]
MSDAIPSWPGETEISFRISRLKENMAQVPLDALVITSQHNFEYYTGHRTLFWLSDTRPLLAIVRRDKPGITIIINSGEQRNAYCGRNADVHRVFYNGFTEVALDAAGDFLRGLPNGAAIGFDYGRDMFGRGSLSLFDVLRGAPNHFQLTDAADLIWRQRLIKSEHELDAKRRACNIATSAFFDGLADLRLGMSEYEFGQSLKQRMIGLGADSVDWLPVRFGRGGQSYAQPNGDTKLQNDDFVWVDMGARRADQISDLNRVAKVGRATPEQEETYEFVRNVTLRLADGIRPGMTGHDAYALFDQLWSVRKHSGRLAIAGRVGHGSGIALTEPPSLMAGSAEIILEDMVLHVEPKLEAAAGVFQMEEVFRVTPSGPEFLSTASPAKLPVVEL